MRKEITLFIYVTFIFILTSCSKSGFEMEIIREYENYNKEFGEKEVDINVEVIEVEDLEFNLLAKSEIQILKAVNNSINKQLLLVDSIQLIFKQDIDTKKCLMPHAVLGSRKEYLEKIKLDSIFLKENKKRSIKLKIEKIENETKILEIIEMANNESTLTSKNYRVKHVVNLSFKDEILVDTLYYLSFNNNEYHYLNRNLFLEN